MASYVILSGIISDIYSDILSGILADIWSDILSGIQSGILPGTHSEILFGILSGNLWQLFGSRPGRASGSPYTACGSRRIRFGPPHLAVYDSGPTRPTASGAGSIVRGRLGTDSTRTRRGEQTRGSELRWDEGTREDEEEEEGGRGRSRKRRRRSRKATLLESRDPHLAGGEKPHRHGDKHDERSFRYIEIWPPRPTMCFMQIER